LSYSGKIFDPLGLILCVTIVVKIIFQGLWEKGITWDEPLPPDIQHEWLNWRTQLPEISNIRISRCYSPVNSKIIDRQLIGFCDASEKAYCSVVYLRSLDRAGGVHISLIMAKTRVAPPSPLKKVCLPLLALCGAHLLSQLMKHLQEILAVPTCNHHTFTNSTIVLYWIHESSQRFKTFEANRSKNTSHLKNGNTLMATKIQLILDLVAFYQLKSSITNSGGMDPSVERRPIKLALHVYCSTYNAVSLLKRHSKGCLVTQRTKGNHFASSYKENRACH